MRSLRPWFALVAVAGAIAACGGPGCGCACGADRRAAQRGATSRAAERGGAARDERDVRDATGAAVAVRGREGPARRAGEGGRGPAASAPRAPSPGPGAPGHAAAREDDDGPVDGGAPFAQFFGLGGAGGSRALGGAGGGVADASVPIALDAASPALTPGEACSQAAIARCDRLAACSGGALVAARYGDRPTCLARNERA
jgi:hypothetical protein